MQLGIKALSIPSLYETGSNNAKRLYVAFNAIFLQVRYSSHDSWTYGTFEFPLLCMFL